MTKLKKLWSESHCDICNDEIEGRCESCERFLCDHCDREDDCLSIGGDRKLQEELDELKKGDRKLQKEVDELKKENEKLRNTKWTYQDHPNVIESVTMYVKQHQMPAILEMIAIGYIQTVVKMGKDDSQTIVNFPLSSTKIKVINDETKKVIFSNF